MSCDSTKNEEQSEQESCHQSAHIVRKHSANFYLVFVNIVSLKESTEKITLDRDEETKIKSWRLKNREKSFGTT